MLTRSREEPVGRLQLQAMLLAGREPVDVRAARVILRREPASPHGFVVLATGVELVGTRSRRTQADQESGPLART
ncbi:hypothetical protein ACFXPW_03525 [Streptomyces goshikiensis]|uniref:hypothetical protein n=1 Tax=Streptomyces goshikiensis TaxID=1942 RepID=UPI00369C075A